MTGDTSTMNDLVTRQYENLPYPEFSPLNISNEERHYNVGMDSPASIFPAHTLEKHNHYLHRGNQNFRQVVVLQNIINVLLKKP